jgi:hypothetical protein
MHVRLLTSTAHQSLLLGCITVHTREGALQSPGCLIVADLTSLEVTPHSLQLMY